MRFVLVHGGHHGAWCWDKLTPELEALGHTTLAIDLPGSGQRMDETSSFASWRATFRDVVEDGDVLVGHSMGGFAISLGADEVPEKVSRLIYLSAAVPVEGGNMGNSVPDTSANFSESAGMPWEDFIEMVDLPNQGPCVAFTNPSAANAVFYHDCSPEDQAWAFEHLTPLPVAPTLETFELPRFWASSIPRDFIVCTDDFSHPIEADNEFMSRLGLSTAFSIISSHSPFISRPKELARLLDAAASGVLAS
jgi:pimeloyl-ACP methyl ester carboxylesterase